MSVLRAYRARLKAIVSSKYVLLSADMRACQRCARAFPASIETTVSSKHFLLSAESMSALRARFARVLKS